MDKVKMQREWKAKWEAVFWAEEQQLPLFTSLPPNTIRGRLIAFQKFCLQGICFIPSVTMQFQVAVGGG
jgi:hypothetical protein